MTAMTAQHDFAHDRVATDNRLRKARRIADWLHARHYTPAAAAALTPRARRTVERVVGVNPSGSNETWELVEWLLGGLIDHDADA